LTGRITALEGENHTLIEVAVTGDNRIGRHVTGKVTVAVTAVITRESGA